MNQHSQIKIIPDSRLISLTFTYRFGGFQGSDKAAIDKARYKSNL